MKSRTKQILRVMHVLSWIVFLGLCIKTGAILYSFAVSHITNPVAAKDLHLGLDLSELFAFDKGHYNFLVLMIVLLSALKAYVFYFAVKIFLKINFVNPFNRVISELISKISYVSLAVGLLTVITNRYCEWLEQKAVRLPELQDYTGGAAEFLLLGGIIFMIAQVFKRGIEIQTENELTV